MGLKKLKLGFIIKIQGDSLSDYRELCRGLTVLILSSKSRF